MDSVLQFIGGIWGGLKEFFAHPPRLFQADMVFRVILQVVLLFGSSFFSGSETALFSLSRFDLQRLRRERNPQSATLHALLDQPRRLIISILCGNEVVNIAAAANMTGILSALYGVEHAAWGSTFVMVPLLLLFGEVTPKTIAVSDPPRISTKVVAAPMNFWVRSISPVTWAVRKIADRITTVLVGEEKKRENILRVDEFRTLVEDGVLSGELTATERVLVNNLLRAGATEIVEIMTPRTRIGFINASMTVPEIVERFITYRHPRAPVFREHRDNVIGFIHSEDVQRLILAGTDLSTLQLKDILHPPVMVPLTKQVDEMLDFFQKHNVQAALVLNEFGGVDGLLTVRDILAFIFGQISGPPLEQDIYHDIERGIFEVPGNMKLNELNTITNFGISDPRMTTIAGVVLRHLDRLPNVGDEVILDGLKIQVLEMDAHRISRVRLYRGTLAVNEVPDEGSRKSGEESGNSALPHGQDDEDGQN